MAKSATHKVPKQMQSKFTEITAITDDFCFTHLNAEYTALSRQLTAALCRKRPSPLVRGKAKSWACGIVHALGLVNFLYDSSQTPHIKASELYKLFGVGQSTGQGKSKQIRDLMKIHQMDPNWCLPSIVDKNPLIWMISINGMILDIRNAPYEVQEAAFHQGIIPYIPEDRGLKKVGNKSIAANTESIEIKNQEIKPDQVYVLDVYLIEGIVAESFIKKNPIIFRTIEIQATQTLETLHQAIFEAFDREDEHMYEFQVGGDGPDAPNSDRYGLSAAFTNEFNDIGYSGDVKKTKIGSLNLKLNQPFGYTFDFGDNWWHQIEVADIKKKTSKQSYPIISKRVGESPPQYIDWNEEN